MRSHVRHRAFAAVIAGTVSEAAINFGFWWTHAPLPSVPTALGILVAFLASVVGGPLAGLAVAIVGWILFFGLVADEEARVLLALPAWLAVPGVAGWIATRLARSEMEADILAGELACVRRSVSSAILTVDATGTIAAWSEGAVRMFGYPAEDAIG